MEGRELFMTGRVEVRLGNFTNFQMDNYYIPVGTVKSRCSLVVPSVQNSWFDPSLNYSRPNEY